MAGRPIKLATAILKSLLKHLVSLVIPTRLILNLYGKLYRILGFLLRNLVILIAEEGSF